MKKILLSCVTCLLALGLVTACEDEVEDVTPEDPNAGVVEPGEDDGGSTEKGEEFLPVLGTVTTGDYFLGIEVDSVPYYFNGEVLQSYYGDVSEHGYEAVTVTVAEVTGGYTLSFAEEEATKYIQMAESDTHRNFVWGDDPYVWSYDTTFDTFVALDSEGVYYYMGSYGSYKEMTLSQYSYLEEGASSYEQYPAHLYDVITYVAPTAITVTANGESSSVSVEVGRRISLTATATGEGNVDPRVTWTSSDETKATVSDSGSVLGVAEGEVTITATSILDSNVKGELTITVAEASTPLVTYKLGSCDERNLTYYWFTGSTTGSTYLKTSTSWNDAVDVYIEAIDDDSTDNSCTLSFYDTNSESIKYIAWDSSTSFKLDESPCTWIWDSTNEYFYTIPGSGSNRFIGQYSNGDFRAYAVSNSSDYVHASAYTEEPTALTAKATTPTLTEATSISAGEYYLGSVDADGTAHLIDGRAVSNVLTTATDFSYAAKVTVAAGDSDTWTMSIGESQYIYATGSTSNLGIGAGTSTNNVKGFTWNATMCTFTYVDSNSDNYYLEFYNNNVTAYKFTAESGNSNIAHLYQEVLA